MTAVGPPDWAITAFPLIKGLGMSETLSAMRFVDESEAARAAAPILPRPRQRLDSPLMGLSRSFAALALTAALLPSCAAPQRSPTFDTAAGEYTRAFEAAKDELRAAGFELERVDARAGVITTRPSASAGLFTPLVRDEHTFGAEWDGAANAERRVVTVRFLPASASDGAGDLRDADAPLQGEVEVEVRRLYRPGRTPESASVRLTTQFRDPAWQAAGLQPDVISAYGEDPDLAAALASRIARRASSAQ